MRCGRAGSSRATSSNWTERFRAETRVVSLGFHWQYATHMYIDGERYPTTAVEPTMEMAGRGQQNNLQAYLGSGRYYQSSQFTSLQSASIFKLK